MVGPFVFGIEAEAFCEMRTDSDELIQQSCTTGVAKAWQKQYFETTDIRAVRPPNVDNKLPSTLWHLLLSMFSYE